MFRETAASTVVSLPRLFHSRSRQRDLFELAIGYGLILIVLWTPRSLQRPLYLVALTWILAVSVLSFEGWTSSGLRPSRPTRSLWVLGPALLLATVAIVFALRLRTLHLPHGTAPFIKAFWGYAIWSLVQQFLLQCFVLLRLLRILPSQRSAIAVAGGLFALAHLPNPLLTVFTLVWGLAACMIFLRYRNLYTLGLMHAILGISLAITVPGPLSRNMRVGLGYLRYPATHRLHLSQSDHTVSTEACVIAAAPTLRSARHARP